jgi:hypothetical protein
MLQLESPAKNAETSAEQGAPNPKSKIQNRELVSLFQEKIFLMTDESWEIEDLI